MTPGVIRAGIVTPKISHFEVPMFRLAASLDGLDVHVFHNDLRGDAFYDHDYGTTIDWGERLRAGYPNTGFSTFAELRAGLMKWRPSVVLMYGYAWRGALALLAELRGRRVPTVHRGTLSPLEDPRSKSVVAKVRRQVRPIILRCFDGHHYGGSYSEAVLQEAGVPAERRYFVPFSVDSDYFSAEADTDRAAIEASRIRRQCSWRDDDPVILLIGGQSWVKGADLFTDIAERLQKRDHRAKFLVVGSGPLMEASRRACERQLRPGSYHFAGYVPSKATIPYYLASTLVVFPSRYETWARGVNEAMLCRRPCIVTRNVAAAGGLVEDGENGYVVDGLDPALIVDRIAAFLALPVERQTAMGESARRRAKYFSYEANAHDLRRSFVETAGRTRRGSAAA